MDKKAHFNFALEGQDVDKLDIYTLILEAIQSQGTDAKITSGSYNMYYTEVKPTEAKTSKKEKNNG